MAVSWSYGHVNELLEYIAHKRLLGSHSHSHSLLHIKTIYVMCSVLLCWCVVGASVAQLARCLYYYRRLIQASIIRFIIFPVSLVVYRLAYWLLVSEYNAKQCQLLQKYSTIRNGWGKKQWKMHESKQASNKTAFVRWLILIECCLTRGKIYRSNVWYGTFLTANE